MKTTIFPMRNLHMKPAFWGFDRDLKEVMDTIEHIWGGIDTPSTTRFKESDQAYLMSIEIPGANKANLDIQIEDDHLIINAIRRRHLDKGEEDNQKISRTVHIPQKVDKEKIQAHCEDGILYLAFPKVEKAKSKKIEVTEGLKDTTWNKLLSNNNKEKNA